MSRLIKTYLLVGVISALVASPGALSETIGPGLQRLVDLATSELATTLNVDEETVEVVEAQYVTWRDSSAGCPKPGMQYLQVLTNGARIVLRVEETIYHYHSGGSRPPFHCAKPSPIKPLPYRHGEA